MGDKTGIAWTDATWNPVTGCTKVSAGCKHCYAERVFPRAYAGQTIDVALPPEGAWRNPEMAKRPRRFTDVMTHPDRLDQPLRWRKPRRVFVNSMSDLFHDDVPDAFIAQVFAVMAGAWQHTFQILTKRPERMHRLIDSEVFYEAFSRAVYELFDDPGASADWWPLPNVWLGVSVEDQATADQRIPLLLETPAALRFVSYEPALGPVDFVRAVNQLDWLSPASLTPGGIDWIIVGGESGPNARPFDVDWARNTIRQCRASGVACFVKQLGANPWFDRANDYACELDHRAGADMAEWPVDLRVQEWPEVA